MHPPGPRERSAQLALRWGFGNRADQLNPGPPARSGRCGFATSTSAGGVNTGHGWTTWNPNGSFVSLYIAESEAHHVVPVFSYYQIRQSLPGANVARRGDADLGNLADARDDERLLRATCASSSSARPRRTGR